MKEMYLEHKTITDGLWKVYRRYKNNFFLSEKILDIIKEEMPDCVPLYYTKDNVISIVVGKKDQPLTNVQVLSYQYKWQECFEYSLKRYDPTDFLERIADEEAILPQLEELNKQVETAKAKALELYKALPVPKSASSLRSDPECWAYPGPDLINKLPELF